MERFPYLSWLNDDACPSMVTSNILSVMEVDVEERRKELERGGWGLCTLAFRPHVLSGRFYKLSVPVVSLVPYNIQIYQPKP